MTQNTNPPKSPRFPDVFWGLTIFLAINFLVGAMYFKIINP
jgi:hypothetical protein